MEDQSESEVASSTGAPRRPGLLAILITALALALALAHVVWPEVQIDAITLALIVVAVAPWLAPIFKSIELPGGWKFEYQEIQRRVDQVQRRVEEVERLVVLGDTTPVIEDRLNNAVRAFGTYLRAIHPAMDIPAPSVALEAGLDNAQYVAGQIQLDPDFAGDDYSVLREYAHHVLMARYRELMASADAVESGLADYFVAGFTGDPVLGAGLASVLHDRYGDTFTRPAVRNLQNTLRLEAGQELNPWEEGEIFGAAFWEMRQLMEPGEADQVLASAWFDRQWSDLEALREGFPAAVITLVGPEVRPSVRELFERRGLPKSST